VIERFPRPLNESDRRRIHAALAKISAETSLYRALIEGVQITGACFLVGIAYSSFAGQPLPASIAASLVVGAVLYLILRFEKWRINVPRRRMLAAALHSDTAQVVCVEASSYAEFAEYEDLGPMYAFQVGENSLFVLRGQEYYETSTFPSLCFELVTVPGAFFAIHSLTPKAVPVVRYPPSEMLHLSAIQDEVLISGTAANALASLRSAV